MGKAKIAEQQAARIFYVEQYKTAKEISALLPVSEKTIGDWILKNGWKAQRDNKVNSNKNQLDKIRELIAIKSERAISIERELQKAKLDPKRNQELIAILTQESIGLSDEISKWNKTLENLDRENKISLSSYLEIMDNIFKSMQKDYPDVYVNTIEFQEKHLNEISLKYG